MSTTKNKIAKEEYKSLNPGFEELNSKGENEKRIDSKIKYKNWFNNHSGMKNKIENEPILSPTEGKKEEYVPINKNISNMKDQDESIQRQNESTNKKPEQTKKKKSYDEWFSKHSEKSNIPTKAKEKKNLRKILKKRK